MLEAVWWLLAPSTLLALLVALALVAAWARRASLAAALLSLAVAALIAVAALPLDDWLAAPLEGRTSAPDPMPERVTGILVLGGAVDGAVTRARGQLALDDAGERMLAALALARRYPDATIVFTGLFQDTLADEWRGADGRGLLFEPAFAGHEVRFLGAARSTYEEALQATAALAPGPGETWLLVTSALHMPRASLTFRTQGWGVVPFPVDYRSTGQTAWSFDPRIGRRLAELDRVVREWGALWVYERSGRIRVPETPGPGTAVRAR